MYLLDCMKNTAAATLVRNSLHRGDSFDDLTKALHKRFEKPREVFLETVTELQQIGNLSCNAESLNQTVETVRGIIHTLDTYGDGSAHQLITAMLEANMSSELKREWIKKQDKPSVVPHIEVLVDFLMEQESIQVTTKLTTFKKTIDSSRNQRTRFGGPPVKPSKGTVLTVSNTTSCPACSQEHPIHQWSTFKGWTVDRRKNSARKHHLCYNCLGIGHALTSCPSKRRCRHCEGRHHTLLHAQPADSTSSASTEDSVSTQPVSQTRPVTPASGTSTESILQLTGRSQRSL